MCGPSRMSSRHDDRRTDRDDRPLGPRRSGNAVRFLTGHAAQAEARAGATRCAVAPVDLRELSRVPESGKCGDDFERAGAHDIPGVADIHVAPREVVQCPALTLAVRLARALVTSERAELHTGDKRWG